MKQIIATVLLFTMLFVPPAYAQEPIDQAVIARLKMEGFQNSQIMETLSWLTDVHGPRLTGSPEIKAAQEWARARLQHWGMDGVKLEPWGAFQGRGWTLNRFSVEMVEPKYLNLIVHPLAWTPSTKGVVVGQPMFVEIKVKEDFEKYRGKLKDAIVLNGRPSTNRFEYESKRFSEAELAARAQAINPVDKKLKPGVMASYWEEENEFIKDMTKDASIIKFFHDEGVAAVLTPSPTDLGVLLTYNNGYEIRNGQLLPIIDHLTPTFIVAREHYGRLLRLIEKQIPVRLELNLKTTFTPGGTGHNVIAEIAGSDPRLKDEVVMLGGHFDSWHAGTGATDNAAGCAVGMEALRLLKAIGTKPRRTIRLALWEGEEEDYYGSLGYVKQHFGDPATMQLKPEHGRLSAYFNLDNGTGRIRGIYLQGNELARLILEAYLHPFAYLGATTVTTLNTGGTDHIVFDALGLPGFQFIQDPLNYQTRTHHTNLDVYEALSEDDLKQAAVIVASVVWHTAMRDEKLPRKALPKPQP
jgi:hypothetical protein